VTPAEHAWKLRASADPRVLSDQIPSGAVCKVTEQLDVPPAPLRAWSQPAISPDEVVVEKRQSLGFTITNRIEELPPAPTQTTSPTPTATPAPPAPTESQPPPPPPTEPETPAATPTPSSIVEPTNRPEPSSPSALPSSTPVSTPTPTIDAEAPNAEPPHADGPAGPLTTTAPFTLRGAFVWGPLLMLSLLTLLLRVRRRPKRVH
jgi:hypothetical protein